MRKIFALLSVFLTGNAVAQTDVSHMLEFSADSLLQTTLSFDKSSSKGSGTDNDTQLDLDFNYAYALANLKRLQLAGQANYNKGTDAGLGDYENYGFAVGAYWNFSNWGSQVDLMNSAYLSGFLGIGWANEYTGLQERKQEFNTFAVAIGKRFSLKEWGVNHLTYNPEIAFTNLDTTSTSNLRYSQALEFRLLQFSFLW